MKPLFLLLITLLIVSFSFAQVPVKDEPRHHNVFENDFVRILDVRIRPGDTTLYHTHATPSVFIYFTNSKVGSEIINQPASSGINVAGNINYDSLKTPRTHRVWNQDTSWFHVMDIELVNPQPMAKHTFTNIKNTVLLFDEPLVNGYKLQINSRETFTVREPDLRFLLVSLDEVTLSIFINAKEQIRVMKPGHFIWIQPNENVVIRTMNNQQAYFTLLRLK